MTPEERADVPRLLQPSEVADAVVGLGEDDTLAGRIMRIELETGKILGAMECPGHMITVAKSGEIFVASLTGNVFRWYSAWLDRTAAAEAEAKGPPPKN